ncbi:TPA: DNA damage-inducible protein D [Candidatus Avigastranaerophilus faecigallinarum]|nr:DNA damage-inducible protein D [Candidatus Avigastranaerophilus faecigallinarum]
MTYSIDDLLKSPFEKIKRISEDGYEYWSARDLYKLLGYSEYRHFLPVIDKVKEALISLNEDIENHIEDMLDMVKIGSGADRELESLKLSRFACYIAVQNADPSKPNVALGQAYFAIKTRQKELIEEEQERLIQSEEDSKRLLLREQMRKHNKQLAEAANDAGVKEPIDYAIFQNYGYRGLYGGLSRQDIHKRKGLKKSQDILDHMGSTELAANLFRATQTEEKLRRENIQGKQRANQTHYEVGQKVRQTIEELGGTMPEDLPTADSIKKLERQKQKELEDKE